MAPNVVQPLVSGQVPMAMQPQPQPQAHQPQQPNMGAPADDDSDMTFWPEDEDAVPGDVAAAMPAQAPTPVQPAPQQQALPMQAPAPIPQPPPMALAPAAPPVSPGTSAEFDELAVSIAFRQSLDQKVAALEKELGINVLKNPQMCDANNALQVAIYNVRWRPADLLQMGPHKLVEIESMFTAMQMHVLWLENYWRMRNEMVGRAVSAAMMELRGGVSGETVKAKEIQLLRSSPKLREMHNLWLEAHAFDHMLRGMGASFTQLEDGMKRMIDLAKLDYVHARGQARFTQ